MKVTFKIYKKQILNMCFFILFFTFIFQNCSQHSSPQQNFWQKNGNNSVSLFTQSGNGDSYDGKLHPGEYVNYQEGFKCGDTIQPTNKLSISKTYEVTLTSLNPVTCSATTNKVTLNSIENSTLNNIFLGFDGGIYEESNHNFENTSYGISEVYCRSNSTDSNNLKSIDLVTKWNSSTLDSTVSIWIGDSNNLDSEITSDRIISNLNLKRELGVRSVHYTQLAFDLNIDLSSEIFLGAKKYRGFLKSTIDNEEFNIEMSCYAGANTLPEPSSVKVSENSLKYVENSSYTPYKNGSQMLYLQDIPNQDHVRHLHTVDLSTGLKTNLSNIYMNNLLDHYVSSYFITPDERNLILLVYIPAKVSDTITYELNLYRWDLVTQKASLITKNSLLNIYSLYLVKNALTNKQFIFQAFDPILNSLNLYMYRFENNVLKKLNLTPLTFGVSSYVSDDEARVIYVSGESIGSINPFIFSLNILNDSMPIKLSPPVQKLSDLDTEIAFSAQNKIAYFAREKPKSIYELSSWKLFVSDIYNGEIKSFPVGESGVDPSTELFYGNKRFYSQNNLYISYTLRWWDQNHNVSYSRTELGTYKFDPTNVNLGFYKKWYSVDNFDKYQALPTPSISGNYLVIPSPNEENISILNLNTGIEKKISSIIGISDNSKIKYWKFLGDLDAIIFQVNSETSSQYAQALYAAYLDQTLFWRVDDPLSTGKVYDSRFWYVGGNSEIVYVANQKDESRNDLFYTRDQSHYRQLISEELTQGGFVNDVKVAPDFSYLLYTSGSSIVPNEGIRKINSFGSIWRTA